MNIFKKKLIIYLLPAVAFLLWPSIWAEAQTASPGGLGLDKVELWLKADAGITETSDKVTKWEDKSGKGRHYGNTHPSITTITSLPTYNRSSYLMNFWPSIDFHNTSWLVGPSVVPQTTAPRSSYYVFYVAEQDPTQTAGHGIIYALTAGNNKSIYNFVGLNEGKPFLNVGFHMHDRTHQGNGKRYGISVAEFMNSTSVASSIYLNGQANDPAFSSFQYLIDQTSSNIAGFVGGATNNSSQGPFRGNVQEIIVLSGPEGEYLPYAQLERINSYLALKYGIELDAGNYVNSSGTLIWNRSNNSGYNRNIFGLGRDDNSGLLVKQATSYGSISLLTAYVGALTTLNSQNQGALNNNVYVLFGSNQAAGREEYQVAIGPVIPTLFEYRLKAAHKVQLSGQASIAVNLKVNRNASTYSFNRILVSSTADFDPAKTQAYTLTADVASNVTLRNGDYISFAQAQPIPNPNDLSGLTVKIYATADDPDVSGLADGARIGSWINGLVRQGTSSWGQYPNHGGKDADKPRMNKTNDLMNFRPSIRFAATESLFTPSNYTDLPGQYLPLKSDSMYYLFYVSQSSNLSGGRSVIYHRGNQFGWYNGAPAYNTTETNLTSNSTRVYQLSDPTKRGFGITGLVHPNTPNIPPTFYFNGEWQQMPTGVLSNSIKTNFVIGGPTSQFTGDIQELAVFATPNGNGAQPLPTWVIRIINSTLAIKYGITLTEGDYTVPDTIHPSPLFLAGKTQTTVWSRSKAVDATGKKYEQSIFGIGRSAAIRGLPVMSILGIHQKQARPHTYNSQYTSPLAVYVGSELAPLNNANNGTIPEGVFLMFSADEELKSVRELENLYGNNTQFANSGLLPNGANAQTAVYKAQLSTSPLVSGITSLTVRFKNMLTLPNLCYLLVSQSPEFKKEETNLYPFDSSSKATSPIAIRDGDYVTVVTNTDFVAGPGGVMDDLRFWMRPDAKSLTLVEGNKVLAWRDTVGKVPNLTYTKPDGARPYPIYREYDPKSNYHPAVVFNENVENTTNGAILASPKGMMSTNAPEVFTFFTVFANDFSWNVVTGDSVRAYPIGFGDYTKLDNDPSDNRFPAFGVQSNYAKTTGKGRFVDKSANAAGKDNMNYDQFNGNLELFRPKATMIMVHEVEKGKRIRYEFDAYGEDKTTIADMGKGFRMNSHASILGGGSYKGRYVHGPMSEIFAYERQLTPPEKNKIYSYLGLKYGITIDLNKSDETVNFNYTLSDGKSVWPGDTRSTHHKYHNRVAALVRDDKAHFTNKRARSTGDESILFMGIPGAPGQNEWVEFPHNKSAIVWGSTSMPVDSVIFVRDIETICGDIDERMRRVWMVDNSDPDNVEVVIRIGTPYLGKFGLKDAYQAFMLVADSEDKLGAGSIYPYTDASHNWDEVIPGKLVLTEEGYEHEFRYSFKNKLTYLTFGFKELGGQCPTCGFTGSRTLPFNANTWSGSNNATNGAIVIGDNFRTQASVTKDLSNTNLTTQAWNNTLRINRTGNPRGIITASIQLQDTAAATSFEVYDIGGSATAYDNIEIVGICGGVETYPKLYYMTNEVNSTYMIRLNTATGKHNRPSSYVSENSRMRVVFQFPVREVRVKYTIVGSSNNANGTIGLSPISYTCPPPLPPLNEALLAFTQTVFPHNPLQFCSDFRYRFTVTNGNCAPKYLNLTDTLPLHLFVDTLRLGDAYEAGYTTIDTTERYNGRQILKIKNLNLKSGNSILDVVIRFGPGATGQGTNYVNTTKFDYDYIWMDQPRHGESWNTATAIVEGRPEDIEWIPLSWKFTSTRDCYTENMTYTYTLVINNANTTANINFGKVALDISSEDLRALAGRTDSIKFVDGSFKFNAATLNPSIRNDGLSITDGLNLQKGDNTLEFQIRTPAAKEDLVSKFGIAFDFSTDSADDCVIRLFNNLNGTEDIYPCDGRSGIINNKNTTSKIKR